MLAVNRWIFVSAICLALASTACSVREASEEKAAAGSGSTTMLNDDRFTLYDQQSFVLKSLPAGSDQDAFWDDLAQQVDQDSNGDIVITREASGRVLRVVQILNSTAAAVHYAISKAPVGGASEIRLQPLTAWTARMGRPDETVPMLATSTGNRLPVLRAELVTAAGKVH